MARIFQLPRQVPIDGGVVSPGAKANFHLTGTTTDTNTYTDAALTTPHANPVVADAAGVFATIYLDPDVIYALTLDDAADALIYTEDPIQDALTQANIALILTPQTTTESNEGITPVSLQYDELNAFRYMTAAQISDVIANTGSIDVITPLQNAVTVAEGKNSDSDEGGGRVYLPSGTYHIASTLNLATNKLCQIVGDGQLLTSISYTGSGVAVDLAGTVSGSNASFYMADFQISNDAAAGSIAGDGSGTTGFEGNFLGFSPTLERVLIKGFITYNYYLENFENGLINKCRGEKTTKTNNDLYLKNANGVKVLGFQSHGEGARTGNDPTNLARAAYTGSVCIYADNIEGLFLDSVTLEGAVTTADVGIWLEEPADRATPRGGVLIHNYYGERVANGIVLRGFDSDTELRNIDIRGGKLSGSITRGIIGSNFVENVTINAIEIEASANNHLVFDTTCKDVHIGRLSYQNVATGGNSSAFPGIHNGLNFVNTTGVEGTVSVLSSANVTADSSLVDYTPTVISTDYRRIRAIVLNVKITVNVSGSSGRVAVNILPKGEGADSAVFFTLDSSVVAQSTPYTQQFEIPVAGATGAVSHQVFVTTSVSWDIDVDIIQVGIRL